MRDVDILFHDCPTPILHKDIKAVVHGSAAVTLHANDGRIYTYPWINVQRVKVL